MRRTAGRYAVRRLVAAISFLGAIAACALVPALSVARLPPGAVVPEPAITLWNAAEMLGRGHFLEVQRFLERLPPLQREGSALLASLYGKALAARGDLEPAREALLRALRLEASLAAQGELEWSLAQCEILANDFERAARFANAAVGHGYGLAPGFVRFLKAFGQTELYTGPAAGEVRRTDFHLGNFDLIRLPASVNGTPTTAVLDTGASYSIVIRSLAREARVREIPGATGHGRGLHNKEIPLTFGILDHLAFASFELENVPVMVMPDDALLFETSRGELPLPMVLGLHLLKEFTIRISYDPSRLSLLRADPKGRKTDPRQNLFYSRGRVFVRASVNRGSVSPFLFDTGSEATLMTSAGLARRRLPASSRVYPKQVRGIGKARMEWGRVRRVTIGIERFLLRFQDMVVREDGGAFEDGILGASALKPFRSTIDFGRMRLILDEP